MSLTNFLDIFFLIKTFTRACKKNTWKKHSVFSWNFWNKSNCWQLLHGTKRKGASYVKIVFSLDNLMTLFSAKQWQLPGGLVLEKNYLKLPKYLVFVLITNTNEPLNLNHKWETVLAIFSTSDCKSQQFKFWHHTL